MSTEPDDAPPDESGSAPDPQNLWGLIYRLSKNGCLTVAGAVAVAMLCPLVTATALVVLLLAESLQISATAAAVALVSSIGPLTLIVSGLRRSSRHQRQVQTGATPGTHIGGGSETRSGERRANQPSADRPEPAATDDSTPEKSAGGA